MAYSFPVFRRGKVFNTGRIVSSEEAARIADVIKSDPRPYRDAFVSALAHNNGDIKWDTDLEDYGDTNPRAEVRQKNKESYILDFPPVSFRYGDFSIKAGNSVTICRHEKQSKIWTRLACTRFGGKRIKLTAVEVKKFFEVASKNSGHILDALTKVYFDQTKLAGVILPPADGYYFQLRAFNSTTRASHTLLDKLQNGLAVSEALDDQRFRTELIDYFQIALGKEVGLRKIKQLIKHDEIDLFGYKSAVHQALFTAQITKSQTDLCGFGYDTENKASGNVLSRATTKDLLKNYAQNF